MDRQGLARTRVLNVLFKPVQDNEPLHRMHQKHHMRILGLEIFRLIRVVLQLVLVLPVLCSQEREMPPSLLRHDQQVVQSGRVVPIEEVQDHRLLPVEKIHTVNVHMEVVPEDLTPPILGQ